MLICTQYCPGFCMSELTLLDATQSSAVKHLDRCSRGNSMCKYILFLVQISMQMHSQKPLRNWKSFRNPKLRRSGLKAVNLAGLRPARSRYQARVRGSASDSGQLAKSQAKVYSYRAFLNFISSRDYSYKSANKNLTISLSSSGSVRTHLQMK